MKILTIDELYERGLQLYKHYYGDEPEIAGIAPGRVNLIGEHTDYNGGFVFPMVRKTLRIITF